MHICYHPFIKVYLFYFYRFCELYVWQKKPFSKKTTANFILFFLIRSKAFYIILVERFALGEPLSKCVLLRGALRYFCAASSTLVLISFRLQVLALLLICDAMYYHVQYDLEHRIRPFSASAVATSSINYLWFSQKSPKYGTTALSKRGRYAEEV